ncbi:Thiamine-phosphate synthase [Porphyromonas levii]|uniref:thiamine phosphate synthase n=1 Tax=Porphyromonas levii TaxID=28114 RepID=UPI001B8C035D|nr:thiamine phosphate synthase [Porphyromonas levii]MBR8731041.1 Thiamine-phosphate synthase [Porphyromonas levii]
MKVIVLTPPTPFPSEREMIKEIIEEGIYRLHLRRPDWSEGETRAFLESFSADQLSRIVLHDHHQLSEEYPIGGVHFNRRHPFVRHYHFPCSISCHTLEEVQIYKPQVNYLFLSPIFDSISKEGYGSAFSLDELREAGDLIDQHVFALGGVSLDKLPLLRELSFGGVALLGDFWQHAATSHYIRNYL